MNNTINPLLSIGLTEKQAKIYLACLEYGPLSISEVAKYSGLKRAHLYNLIEELLTAQYMCRFQRGKRPLYKAESPQKILELQEQKVKALAAALPTLQAISSATNNVPQTTLHDSPAGLKDVYENIYQHVTQGKEVWFLSHIDDLISYDTWILRDFKAAVLSAKKSNVRELLADSKTARTYVESLRDMKLRHPIRFMDTSFQIYNDLIILKDIVVIVSLGKYPSALVIHDAKTQQTFRTLFEMAWMSADEKE
ncbi:MAG: transcriptional regulator TrmB [Candidatus Peribacteria bacterium]|nr:transcriptional regulator TrmB [Candidatus Peribacteria bacterium]